MARTDAQYSLSAELPQNPTMEDIQAKIDYWIHHGRAATGENKAWTDGMIKYLRKRLTEYRHVNEDEFQRRFREMRERDGNSNIFRPAVHSRIRTLFG